MKNYKVPTTLVLFLAIGCSAAFGQVSFKPGFIIKQNNDTIFGEIQDLNEREKAQKCVFRSSGEENEFSPGEIKAYKITDGNLYESHEVLIADAYWTIFLLTLVKGRASLYFYVDTDHKDHYFAQKRDIMKEIQVADESFEQWDYEKSKNSVGTLTIMFNDCPDPERRLNASSFHPNRIQEYFIDYNNCYEGSGTSVVGKREKGIRLIKGVEVGYSYSELKWKSPYNFKTDNGFIGYNLNFGAVIGVDLTETRISILSGIYYGSYTWEGTQFDTRKTTSFDYYEYALSFSYIKVPLAVKLNITQGKISPYVKAGAFMDLWISSDTEQTRLLFMDPDYSSSSKIESYMDEQIESELATSDQGFLAGIGVEYKLNEKMIIYFETLYEGGNGILKKTFSTYSNFNFKLGFSF